MKEKLEKLKGLCDLFRSNIKEYKSGKYDEANTRVDFIDKFFECLDWDVRNNQGLTESNREVVREDKVIIDKKPKAPDYSFRIGGSRKFFLEAKKPSVNVKEEIEPAFQIRRYGYTAKLSLSILTDFEEFAVYDTRIKPNKNDKANVARIFYCTFEDYEKQFAFLYNTFSKGAILNGSFDKYALENKTKKGSSEVDKEFLSLIEDWRESLAKNIAIRNKDLDIYSLNSAVQVIIDRIIFIRIAEDRNMEEYGLLLEACNQGMNNRSNIPTYQYLNQVFLDANKKYNSGLFNPKKWISDLSIDDKIFQTIIRNLYYPECPYELSVLPIEILGNIYEQFLGKTIRLTSGHQAKVEEKEEVRKAGGVYYTPQYIVNYIVQNTVGEKIKGVDLYNHPKLTILDPACGSGSFLVGAYSFLLEKYLESYTDKKRLDKSLKNGLIYQVSRNTYRLSITVKQNILLHHIYGVDIDNQAVEVTKLSLLLKLMEDENTESADRLFKHSDIKLLPDLDNNIKCGNSLIGSDFYENKNLSLFGKDEMRKVNTFDWEKEFIGIFKGGGFDCVIGNPPWGAELRTEEKLYLKSYSDKSLNTAYLFIEKGLNILNKNASLHYIIPKGLSYVPNLTSMREYLLNNFSIYSLVDSSEAFRASGVELETMLIHLGNKKIQKVKTGFLVNDGFKIKEMQKDKVLSSEVFAMWLDHKAEKLVDKIKNNSIQLGQICTSRRGIGINKFVSNKKAGKIVLGGKTIFRYKIGFFTYAENKYIESNFSWQKIPKIMMQEIVGRIGKPLFGNYRKVQLNSTIDEDGKYYTLDTVVNLFDFSHEFDMKYVLAMLNSKLVNWYFHIYQKNFSQLTLHSGNENSRKLPILKTTKANQKKIISLVEQMLAAQKELLSALSESDKKILQQKCDLLDKQIDKLVYELYGLTEAEIKIVEGD